MSHKTKKRGLRGGFTLVEIIAAVAALTLLSGFILNMFAVSGRSNALARDIDQASMLASNAIESFKSLKSPDGGAAALGEHSAWYDGEWNVIPSGNTSAAPKGAVFALKTSITRTDGGAGGIMMGITAECTDLTRETALVSYKTGKYFSFFAGR